MIKVIVILIVALLAWAFLAEPVMQAGRAVAKQFKRIWENTDENTDLHDNEQVGSRQDEEAGA
jgi:hypothetical protein